MATYEQLMITDKGGKYKLQVQVTETSYDKKSSIFLLKIYFIGVETGTNPGEYYNFENQNNFTLTINGGSPSYYTPKLLGVKTGVVKEIHSRTIEAIPNSSGARSFSFVVSFSQPQLKNSVGGTFGATISKTVSGTTVVGGNTTSGGSDDTSGAGQELTQGTPLTGIIEGTQKCFESNIVTTYNTPVRLRLYIGIVEQSLLNNTSTIKWELRQYNSAAAGSTLWYSYGQNKTVNVYMDSESLYSSGVGGYTGTVSLAPQAEKILVAGTKVVTHNNDGTLTKYFSADHLLQETGGYDLKVPKTAYTFLTIPRAASISSLTSGLRGLDFTVKWTPKLASHTFKLKISGLNSDFTESLTPATTSETSYTKDLTSLVETYFKNNTTVKTVSVTATLTTLSSSSEIGTDAKSISIDVTKGGSSDIGVWTPKISSFTVTPATIGSFSNSILKGINNATLKVNYAVGSTSKSAISSINFSGSDWDSGSITATSQTTHSITQKFTTKGSQTVKCVVTDARGLYHSSSKTISVIDYSKPVLSNLVANRDTSDYQKGVISYKTSFTQFSENNGTSTISNGISKVAVVITKQSDGTTLASKTFTSAGAITSTVTNLEIYNALDANETYQVKVTVTDKANQTSASKTTTIKPAFALLNFGAGGLSMGIGEVASKLEDINNGVSGAYPLKIKLETAFLNKVHFLDTIDINTISASTANITTVGSSTTNASLIQIGRDDLSSTDINAVAQLRAGIGSSTNKRFLRIQLYDITNSATINRMYLYEDSLMIYQPTVQIGYAETVTNNDTNNIIYLDNGKITANEIFANSKLNAKGGIEIWHPSGTPFIDFHASKYSGSSTDYDARIIYDGTEQKMRFFGGGLTSTDFITLMAKKFDEYSDARLKENIKDFPEEYLDLLSDLQVKQFNFIGDSNISVGLIAQEVLELEKKYNIEKSFIVVGGSEKTLVVGNKEYIDYYGINYNTIFIMLLKKVQLLERELKELKGA